MDASGTRDTRLRIQNNLKVKDWELSESRIKPPLFG